MPYSAGPSPESGPPKPGRVFYPYTECEEFRHGGGMWKPLAGAVIREKMIEGAARLMRDAFKFRSAMLRALDEWPKSCAVNLTAEGNNQRAWLGHAGCYLAVGSPEECTRLGWHRLNPAQQRAANAAADDAINTWRRRYRAPITSSDQLSIFGDTHA